MADKFKNPWAAKESRWFNNSIATTNNQALINNAIQTKKYSKVINAVWVNSAGETINKLPYGDNTANINIEFNNDSLGENYRVTIIDHNSVSNTIVLESGEIKTNKITIQNKIQRQNFKSFNKILSLIVKVDIISKSNGSVLNTYKSYPQGSRNMLLVHAISFIPEIMKNFGWHLAAKTQDEWFKGNSLITSTDNPKINFFDFDWVLKYPHVNVAYQNAISEKIWINEAAQIELIDQLRRMVNEGLLVLPTQDGYCKSFGSFSQKSVKYTNSDGIEVVTPLFDKFHHTERGFNINYIELEDKDLTELIGALANFAIRFVTKGQITKMNDKYIINITDVGVYVRDAFNFIDTRDLAGILISQPLGYWSILEGKTSTSKINDSYYYINNDSYNYWRKLYDKGEDYTLYSKLNILENLDDNFEINISSF